MGVAHPRRKLSANEPSFQGTKPINKPSTKKVYEHQGSEAVRGCQHSPCRPWATSLSDGEAVGASAHPGAPTPVELIGNRGSSGFGTALKAPFLQHKYTDFFFPVKNKTNASQGQNAGEQRWAGHPGAEHLGACAHRRCTGGAAAALSLHSK